MTDKVSYKLPSWNPFAAAEIYRGNGSGIDIERLQRIENTKKFREALKVIEYTRHDDLEPDELQDLIDDGLLNLSKKEAYFKKQEIPKPELKTVDEVKKNTQKKTTTSYRKNDSEEQITLESMPNEKRDKDKEKIFAKKVDQHIDDWKKIKSNAVEKGYLHPPIADKMIIALDSMHLWLLPLVNDTWTQGKWINAYPQYVEAYKTSHNLWEDPKFLIWQYQMLKKNGKVVNQVPYRKNHLVPTILEKKFNIVAQLADRQPFELFKLIWENDEHTRHQQILMREVSKSKLRTTSKRKKKVSKMSEYTTDPDDYGPDMEKLGYHDDPETSPIVPPHFRNKEEYTIAQEPNKMGLVKKDNPEDNTEYFQKLSEYAKYQYKEDMGPETKKLELEVAERRSKHNKENKELEALEQFIKYMKERHRV